jgi:hypothetical protein
MVARLQPGQAFSTAAPQAVFNARNYFLPLVARGYDVSPDGRRFLMLKPEADAAANDRITPELVVVEHWTAELKRRVPTK